MKSACLEPQVTLWKLWDTCVMPLLKLFSFTFLFWPTGWHDAAVKSTLLLWRHTEKDQGSRTVRLFYFLVDVGLKFNSFSIQIGFFNINCLLHHNQLSLTKPAVNCVCSTKASIYKIILKYGLPLQGKSEAYNGQACGINLKHHFSITVSCKYCNIPIRILKNYSSQRLVQISHQKPKQKVKWPVQSAGKEQLHEQECIRVFTAQVLTWIRE